MSSRVPLEERLLLTGLSYRTAEVELRERLAFRAEDMPRALGEVLAQGFHEVVILSTCNRVEVIAVAAEHTANPAERLRHFLSEFHAVPEAQFAKSLYQIAGADVARHLFEVAGSIDSQILGETEILSQSKEAYRIAASEGRCGPVLRHVFERSFFLAKELRTDGGIGRSQASVSSAAVNLANKLFEVKGRKVLVVGTGEMASGIVRALKSAGVGEILVASRTESRAKEFAQQEGGTPCLMQHLVEHLKIVDIVLASSAAPHFIIGPEQIKQAAPFRRGNTLCLIDISVPRNVDPAVHELDDTYLYDIDDLEEVASEGRREREAVAERWRPRLASEAREVLRQLQDVGSKDAARKLMEYAAVVRKQVLEQVRKDGMSELAIQEMERALERLQGRLLHGPLDTLRQAVREGDGGEASAWVSRLFRLEAPQNADEAPTAKKSCKDPEPSKAAPVQQNSLTAAPVSKSAPAPQAPQTLQVRPKGV